LDRAWSAIQRKVEIIEEQLGIPSLRLERVLYDKDSFTSRIEELPDEPKSPSPDQVQVQLSVEAIYRIPR
jgi:hypothetical protein